MTQAKTPLSRRHVMAGAGTAGAVAAAVSLLPLGTAPQQAATPATKPAADETGGYRLTAHVQRYYQTAKV